MAIVGKKVTTGPDSKKPNYESAGLVTSDSLAAESIEAHGGFSDNKRAGVSKQPSRSTTSNTTDNSNATVLDPAPYAEAREAAQEWDESIILAQGRAEAEPISNSRMEETGGKVLKSGEMSNPIQRASSKDARKEIVDSGRSNGADNAKSARDHGKSKGTSRTREFDGLNASFNGDIGGNNDPGRLAEQQFAKSNAENASVSGQTGNFANAGEDTQYEVLDERPA